MRRFVALIALGVLLGAAPAAWAQGLTWSAGLGTGVPSAPASDAQFHAASPTVYITQGSPSFPFDATPAGAGARRWAAPRTFAGTVQNFPSPVPLKNGTIAIFVADMKG